MVFRVVLKLYREMELNVDLKRYGVDSNGFINGYGDDDKLIVIKDWVMVYELKETATKPH